MMSSQEFIYSFRKAKDSPFPKYTDQEAIDALYKIKELKDALASGKFFSMLCFLMFFNISFIFF